MIAQITNEEKVRQLPNEDKIAFYISFNPTADSLHIEHFVQIMIVAHMQRAGHASIALFGGDTSMTGDPSGKSGICRVLTKKDTSHNIAYSQEQMSHLIDFSEGEAIMANNDGWLLNLSYIGFIRKTGVYFSADRTLAAERYKQRLERGLSFFELSYMVMQNYDFFEFNEHYSCILQMGGDDQWSNTIGGIELVRRMRSKEACGVTFTLLATSGGKKMGKTEKGAVRLDPEKTSPFDFYQCWRNMDDADMVRCMKLLTLLPLSKIVEYGATTGSELNQAGEVLAFGVTKLTHGGGEAAKVQKTVRILFDGGRNSGNMPNTELPASDLAGGSMGVLGVMVKIGLIPSKGGGRRLVQQGGVSVDDQKITAVEYVLIAADFEKGSVIIRKGKKALYKVVLQK